MEINSDHITSLFYTRGFAPGRLLSQSKSGYRRRYPDNKVVFNANIVIEGEGKVWFGDLDITRDESLLKEIAKELDKDLCILSEMDARFGSENTIFEELKARSYFIVKKPI